MFEFNDVEYVERKLKTNIKNGLDEKEVLRRQKNNGYNLLAEKRKDNVFKIFFHQLQDPMIYILVVAISISFFLKEYTDAIVVLIVVVLNALIGAFQEIKTERALEALKKLSEHKCSVIREGKKKQIDSSMLVIGDLVVLESGCSIPADLRIVESANLGVDESSITGESKPVKKGIAKLNENTPNLGDKENMGYMSTLVVSGRGKGIVTATGMKTEIGKIASILKDDSKSITPLQKRLFDLGKLLGIITICICMVMFVVALLENRNPLDMLISSISLAVAAIPEGLPAVVTIVLAIGVQRMIKVNVIVKRLPSVETLGSVSVVCTDKTGTLTENKLQVIGVYESGLFSEGNVIKDVEFLRNINLCNNAYKENDKYVGNAMEVALCDLSYDEFKEKRYLRLEEKEFDSTRKMMSTLNEVDNKKIQYTKGAYDRIIQKCKYIKIDGQVKVLDANDIMKLNEAIDHHASLARRILAFAYKENVNHIKEEDMIFLGFATFMDPPKKGVKESVENFKKAGVKTVMITGDYIKTAYAIAKDLGIANNEEECISGDKIDNISDEELKKIVEKKTVFARVSPAHKSKIVEAIKQNGHVVAMTGDGVNDAPSLKKADIGISMGITGSDVSKEASDMILLDDNFSTIESAIEEGRAIYNNIKKSVLFLLSSNFSEIIVMVLAIILGLPLPLMAIHILVVNLLTDSIPALALGADLKENDIMGYPPIDSKESLFSDHGLFSAIFYGVLIALFTFFAFLLPSLEYMHEVGVDLTVFNIKWCLNDASILKKSQTFAFVAISLSELFHSLSLRNEKESIFRKDIFKNIYLDISIVAGMLIIYFCVASPLKEILKFENIECLEMLILMCFGIAVMLVKEISGPLFHMKHKRQTRS